MEIIVARFDKLIGDRRDIGLLLSYMLSPRPMEGLLFLPSMPMVIWKSGDPYPFPTITVGL